MDSELEYDYVIIGSGFGGSVSALRLSEKGYKILVIEKGKWFSAKDFPKNNWRIRKWLWLPKIKCFGILKLTFLRHVGIISGVGVGGGSLVYANTLPQPKSPFYKNGSWANLKDWETDLALHYDTALMMLGASKNPILFDGDKAIEQLAKDLGKEKSFDRTNVAVYFGKPNETVNDPYFEGKGPDRTGCNFCGKCMTGCPNNSKNTLDKNYLHLAQQYGATILAENIVTDVKPIDKLNLSKGYEITFKKSTRYFAAKKKVTTKGVIYAGGVLGTLPLLLKLQKKSLPKLSKMLGRDIRTNNESLILNVSMDKSLDMSKGVAIGSILDLDENNHLEPVRYGEGSGFWRTLMLPMVSERNFFKRIGKLIILPFTAPVKWFKVLTTRKFANRTSILLFMQNLDSTLRFRKSWMGIVSRVSTGKKPSAFIKEAHELAKKHGELTNSKSVVIATETITGIPSTAHILGGCVMGKDDEHGVIDKFNQVFNYQNMYVCDGSMISANPGVNPSLSITAITEHAMSYIPPKEN